MCKKRIPVEKKIIIEERKTSNWAKTISYCAFCVLCYKVIKLFVAPDQNDDDLAKKVKAHIDILNNKKDAATTEE
jgi:hypothetical protein